MCQREYPQRERLLLYCSLKPCYSTSPCLLLLCCSVPPVQGQPQSITCFLGRVDRTNTCPLQVRPSSMIGVFIVQCMNACVSSWHQQVTPIVGETDWLFLIWVAAVSELLFSDGTVGSGGCKLLSCCSERWRTTYVNPPTTVCSVPAARIVTPRGFYFTLHTHQRSHKRLPGSSMIILLPLLLHWPQNSLRVRNTFQSPDTVQCVIIAWECEILVFSCPIPNVYIFLSSQAIKALSIVRILNIFHL